jgi:hypothetical protein
VARRRVELTMIHAADVKAGDRLAHSGAERAPLGGCGGLIEGGSGGGGRHGRAKVGAEE